METGADLTPQDYLQMWERGKLEAVKLLRHPEAAAFPDYDDGMVSHEECGAGEFLFDTYVDVENDRERYVRTRVRMKFSAADRSYLGASFQKPKVVRRWLSVKIVFEWEPFRRAD